MKMIFTLSLILASTSTVYAANDLQEIDCRFPNPESKDHVVVTLENAQKGFFTYTTGVEDTGEAQNTGKVVHLYRIEDSKRKKTMHSFQQK